MLSQKKDIWVDNTILFLKPIFSLQWQKNLNVSILPLSKIRKYKLNVQKLNYWFV